MNSPVNRPILEEVLVVDLKDGLCEDLRAEIEELILFERYVVFNPNRVFFALLVPGLKERFGGKVLKFKIAR